ncbi:MAG: T9SS type A sorting domain-containing protein [Taibaiella sp.]|nr:T9SS type A sorting domain-containing protein [Taibaiella sp.]
MAKKLCTVCFMLTILPLVTTAQIILNTSVGTYNQNFDGLSATGFIDNSTITGLYAGGVPNASDGSNFFVDDYYKYTLNSEYALGVQVSNGNPNRMFGLRFKNTAGTTIQSLTITYYGEQWSRSSDLSNTLNFYYQVLAPGVPVSSIPSLATPGVNLYPQLDYTAAVVGHLIPLDGNNPSNRVQKTATIAVNIPDDTEFFLAWEKAAASGVSCAIAVDDFNLTWSENSPLPVGLAGFSVSANGAENVLEWQTIMEQQNRGFEIWHSQDAINYNQLGFVSTLAEQGNSTEPLNYVYIHSFLTSKNYYKLVQVDRDGVKKHSEVIMINNAAPDKTRNVMIYPNPASEIVYIDIQKEKNAALTIIDYVGRIVFSKSCVENGRHYIDLSQLQAGKYFVSINGRCKGQFTKK